jgi:capsid protein
MSRLRFWARVNDWRWNLLIPQFCVPVWSWAMEAAEVMGLPTVEKNEWTAPPLPMIEPDKEGLAIQRNIRTGITTLPESIRERGYNPEQFLDELQASFEDLDRRGLVLDCDPRKMTQQGQMQQDTGSRSDDGERELARILSALLSRPGTTRKRKPRANGHDSAG